MWAAGEEERHVWRSCWINIQVARAAWAVEESVLEVGNLGVADESMSMGSAAEVWSAETATEES